MPSEFDRAGICLWVSSRSRTGSILLPSSRAFALSHIMSGSVCELTVTEETTYTVACGTGTKVWKFSSEDITVVDGVQRVALNYLNNTLRNFIIQDTEAIRLASKDRVTCTTMKGYSDLMEMRNLAQLAMPQPEEGSSHAACTLFSNSQQRVAAKKEKCVALPPRLVDVNFPHRDRSVTVKMKAGDNSRDCLKLNSIRLSRWLCVASLTTSGSRDSKRSA